MNNLHRDLVVGEHVVIKERYFSPAYRSLADRVFVVDGGFGMSSETSGTALYGYHLSDGERCRWEGNHIDVDETIKYQEEHKL